MRRHLIVTESLKRRISSLDRRHRKGDGRSANLVTSKTSAATELIQLVTITIGFHGGMGLPIDNKLVKGQEETRAWDICLGWGVCTGTLRLKLPETSQWPSGNAVRS